MTWNQEYVKLMNYCDSDYELMPWYGFVVDYLHAFQILNVVEIPNDGKPYEPLEANLKDASTLSIANE